ncbi:TetR/AcrR family transcriptional regulator [Myxococcota bacterium]|nr:TetR/AcrR family transcriptional regulator [Myxococcota bacterium]
MTPASGAGTNRRERSRERRRRILEAALECFTTLGFTATTLEDIRARSGASTGSVYHHFGGKEQIAGALYVEGLRDYQAALAAELVLHDATAGGVRALVRRHLGWVVEHPDWARYLIRMRRAESVSAAEAEIRETNRSFVEAIRLWLAPRVARGELRALPVDLFLALLLGPSQEFTRLWIEGRARTDVAEAAEVLADAAWMALRGDAVPPGT